MATNDFSSRGTGFVDMTGQVFTRLTVLSYAGTNSDRKALWLCQCECGNKHTTTGKQLRLGKAKSCGCLRKEQNAKASSNRMKDITNHRFSRLSVIKRIENNKSGNAMWLCRCDCGNEIKVSGIKLRNEHTQSCGCLSREKARNRLLKHGYAGNQKGRTYLAWVNMRARCSDPNRPDYYYYGGRGITFDQSWNDFEQFLADMGECQKGYSLDRKDVNGNYCKDNCEWIPKAKQAQNTRKNVMLTYNGETLCLSEMARRHGLTPNALHNRLFKLNWSLETALTEESYLGKNQYTK